MKPVRADQPDSDPRPMKPDVVPNPAHRPQRREVTPAPQPVKVPDKVH